MEGAPGYNPQPTINDKIHCVCIVISGKNFKVMDKMLLSKVKQVRQEAEARGEAAAGCQPLMSVVRAAPAVHPDQD